MSDPFGEGGLGELESPLYRDALAQLDRVAAVMGLDDNIHARLRVPQRATVTTFPFRREGYSQRLLLHMKSRGRERQCDLFFAHIFNDPLK